MNIEAIPYLANIALVMYADGSISPAELGLLEEIRKEMRFKKGEYNAAVRMAENGDHKVTPVGSFADQVKNLEQMLRVAYVDDDLSKSEAAVIVAFCKLIGITQEQLNRLRNDAVASIKHAGRTCPSCGVACQNDAKYCPKCGTDLSSFVERIQTSFQVPSQGIALEFAESTAASFPKAVELAKKTGGYQTCQRGKKTWYLATFDTNQIMDALPLIECLSGLRNKTLYQDGEEKIWDEVFAFSYCASRRDSNLYPVEYCFGKEYNQLNPWGCTCSGLTWNSWAEWFTWGKWEKTGRVNSDYQWRFDMAKIRHELQKNLYRYRFCPYMQPVLIEAVLKHFPEVVNPGSDAGWGYRADYEESPGAIKIVRKRELGAFISEETFWAVGVQPKGFGVLNDIMSKAFSELKMQRPNLDALLT